MFHIESAKNISKYEPMPSLDSQESDSCCCFNVIGKYSNFCLHLQIESALTSTKNNANYGPMLASEAQESAEEALSVLAKLEGDDDAAELAKILTRPWLEGLLSAHDTINTIRNHGNSNQFNAEEALIERLSHYSEPNIKIVRIEKTTEPLGATVKNEGEAVVVARIIRGGSAEATGLLHEGDELLEVNEIELRGKDVNDVCDILAQMQGTLTFLVVPTRQHHLSPVSHPGLGLRENGTGRHGVVHLKVVNFSKLDLLSKFKRCRADTKEIRLSFLFNL